MNESLGQGGCEAPKRISCGEQVSIELDKMAARAKDVAARLSERLDCMTRTEPPRDELAAATKCVETFPPFFSGLRSSYSAIGEALNTIENTLRRLEL